MRIDIEGTNAIRCLKDTIPKSVHSELSRVYEGRQLSERLRTIVNPLVPMRTGNLRFSPVIQRMTTPISKNGRHYDVLTYSAINQDQMEHDDEGYKEYEWNYAYKMETQRMGHYTTPGTNYHYMMEGINSFVGEKIPEKMTANAVRVGIRKGGME